MVGHIAKDQPPHFYRLLAIDLFESDADVISAAADKQMAFIRSFQTGKNSRFSQKILNEIASARICLLNKAKKGRIRRCSTRRMAAEATSANNKVKLVADGPEGHGDAEVVLWAEPADGEVHSPLPQLGRSERSEIRKKKTKSASLVPLAALGRDAGRLRGCGCRGHAADARNPPLGTSGRVESRQRQWWQTARKSRAAWRQAGGPTVLRGGRRQVARANGIEQAGAARRPVSDIRSERQRRRRIAFQAPSHR